MRIPAKLRRIITERAKSVCEYCFSNLKFSQDPFDVEHIIPISENGETVAENLALSCHGCNLHKSNKLRGFDALSDENVRLFNPRNDAWKTHFIWSKGFDMIIGTTPIGRATVETLKLNRQGLINQRRILCAFGEHPPVK